jgi:hypothetical protein
MNYKLLAARFKKSFVSLKATFLLVALLVAASSAFAQVPSYLPTNGLVGWWPFNGNANDESGNGNNGTTINGVSITTDRNGNANSSYIFDGVDDYISVNSSSTLNCNNSLTISVWAKCNNINNSEQTLISRERFQGGVSYRIATASTTYGLGINNESLNSACGQACNLGVSANNSIVAQNWQNITATWDGAVSKIYLNGILINSAPGILGNGGLLLNSTMPLYFGKWLTILYPNLGFQYFSGRLDDIGIWNRALNQQEITTLYNAQSCIGNISPDGPTTFCAGNFVNLTSDVVSGTYQWRRNGVNITTNATSRTFKATSTGSYTCVATCNGTALTSNAIQVTSKTNAFASVTASGATSFCLGDSVTLNCTNLGSNYSVQWYRTNISMENATNYSTVVKQPGTYKVVTRNLTNGCSRISGSAITTAVNCRIAGDITSGTTTEENTTNAARLIDNELSQGVHIYPNPNNGSFNFTYDGEETGDGILQIINTMGQSIYNSAVTVQEGGYNQEIQLGDNYTKGIYIVRLLINGSYHDSRVMVR